MYHFFVRRIVRRAFGRIRPDTVDDVLRNFDDDAVFRFYGDHALGGELRGREAVRGFFERTFRLFPDMHLQALTVVAGGPPWNTVASTRFALRASLPGGETYRNEGMQFLRLRWGKVVEDRLYEDTQLLSEALAHLAERGHDEALAPPLGTVPEAELARV